MTASPPPSAPLPRLGFPLFALVIAGWGLSWPMVKITVGEIEPWTFRALTVSSGGVLLLLAAIVLRLPLKLPTGTLKPLLISTVFNIIGWHIFSAFGILHMGSGHAALIAYSMPIWAALVAIPTLGERLTLRRIAVLALGTMGIAVLLPHGVELLDQSMTGIAFMLAAAVSWAFGVVHFKRVPWQTPVVVIAAWQHLIGAMPIVVIAATLGYQGVSKISSDALFGLAFLILVPIAACTVAWYKVVTLFPTRVSSLGALLVPVLGVISGSLLLGEPLGLKELAAMALICGAVALELLYRPA